VVGVVADKQLIRRQHGLLGLRVDQLSNRRDLPQEGGADDAATRQLFEAPVAERREKPFHRRQVSDFAVLAIKAAAGMDGDESAIAGFPAAGLDLLEAVDDERCEWLVNAEYVHGYLRIQWRRAHILPGKPMTTFHLFLDADERLDITHALDLLKRSFPSTIVEGDTFERKRRRLEETLAELSDEGTPIRNPDHFRYVIARSEMETGPGLDVQITFDDAIEISGSITSGGISLRSLYELRSDVVSEVQDYLLSLKIGEIIVV
jgi:hypothetical protein